MSDAGTDRALERIRARTASLTGARVFRGRADGGYRTADLLELRADHAAARDAVHAPLDLEEGDLAALARAYELPVVGTHARSLREHLLRPDLGRRLTDDAAAVLRDRCPPGADLQLVIGDGLSSAAIHAQVPVLLPLLLDGARARGWSVGRPFVVRHARVGILNDVGALLDPVVVVLLVGERPGLASADGLSAYFGHRPRPGHTDADRNLLSNIRAGGTPPAAAAGRILDFVAAMHETGRSGVGLKEPDARPEGLGTHGPAGFVPQ